MAKILDMSFHWATVYCKYCAEVTSNVIGRGSDATPS